MCCAFCCFLGCLVSRFLSLSCLFGGPALGYADLSRLTTAFRAAWRSVTSGSLILSRCRSNNAFFAVNSCKKWLTAGAAVHLR